MPIPPITPEDLEALRKAASGVLKITEKVLTEHFEKHPEDLKDIYSILEKLKNKPDNSP